jgi:small GTP-binding protein
MRAPPSSASKLVLVGASGVGKTSIVNHIAHGVFDSQTLPTVGAGFVSYTYKGDNKVTRFEIWDTAGQEAYRAISRNYFSGANAALFVFDLSHPESLQELKFYYTALAEVTDIAQVVIGLIGNKSDLKDGASVSDSEIDKWSADLSAEFATSCSAKTGDGIGDIFPLIVSSPRLAGKDAGSVSLETKEAEKDPTDGAKCC